MTQRIVILHGYTAQPNAHWFPWLAEAFAPAGVEVVVPELPDAQAPQLEAWVDAATAAIGEVSEDLVIVGHSLGCITALHALARLAEPWELGGLVLVAGFAEQQETLPELAAFTEQVPELDRIIASTRSRAMIASDDDWVVAPAASAALAADLDATLDVVPNAVLFLDREGFSTLPVARDRIAAALGISGLG